MLASGHLLLGRIMWHEHAMAVSERCVITCKTINNSMLEAWEKVSQF